MHISHSCPWVQKEEQLRTWGHFKNAWKAMKKIKFTIAGVWMNSSDTCVAQRLPGFGSWPCPLTLTSWQCRLWKAAPMPEATASCHPWGHLHWATGYIFSSAFWKFLRCTDCKENVASKLTHFNLIFYEKHPIAHYKHLVTLTLAVVGIWSHR